MLNNCTIWIGLPAFNEEKAIKKVLKSIISLKKKINKIRVIIVNDGSKDKTLLNAKKFQKKLNIKIINNKKNKGLGNALYALIFFFKKKSIGNDKLVLMDCDNTHNPNQIITMLRKVEKKDNFVVIASRFQKGSLVKNVPFLRNLHSLTAFIIFNIFFMTKGIRDFTSGYRLYDKKTIEKFFSIIGNKYLPAAGFEMQLEILLKLKKTNVNFFEIPIILDYKKKPTASKMNIIKTIFNYLKLLILRILD